MNKTLKKFSSLAMALTIIGSGTAITKNIFPQFDNTITAEARVYPQYAPGPYDVYPTQWDSFYPGYPYSKKVLCIQKMLNYLTGWGIAQDGYYGKQTFDCVAFVQDKFNQKVVAPGKSKFKVKLRVDGYYGPKTNEAVGFLMKYAGNYGW